MSLFRRLLTRRQAGMREELFWRIIGKLDWSKIGDDAAVVEPAVQALAQIDVQDILGFQEMLAEKLHALDGERYAREIGEYAYEPGEHFSTDWFLYARCCVVANGREVYEAVLSDPQKMPKDMEFESLLYIARSAYERKTGEEYDHLTKIDFETFSNKDAWS